MHGLRKQTSVHYMDHPAILQLVFCDGYCYLENDFTPLLAASETTTYARKRGRNSIGRCRLGICKNKCASFEEANSFGHGVESGCIESGILVMYGRWAVGRPTSGNAPRPTRRHLVWSSFPVRRIGSLLHCCHPSAERRTPRYLARNMERDVRNRTPVSVAGCRCGSATRSSDERPLREHSDRVPARCVCNVGLLGIKPGWNSASHQDSNSCRAGNRCYRNWLVRSRRLSRQVHPLP